MTVSSDEDTHDYATRVFELLAAGDAEQAACDAINQFTRCKMREPAVMPLFLDALDRARKEFDSLSLEQQEARKRQLDQEEQECVQGLFDALNDESQWLNLCEGYCHEGIQIMRLIEHLDGVTIRVEFGLCSFSVAVDVPNSPALQEHCWNFLTEVPVREWPSAMQEGLKQIVNHIRQQLSHGALGC